ncbi:hypothetical protein SAMN05216315_11327 [Nitrosospira sp. Nsp18]|uniref:hypothetical protein n=1 Tax=Nitrosospira sp. Nsp18 TaxID=1855334 RepID=UPI000888F048|nr:hypothetical protein [Nitrosospira sp. Nsp18]SDA20254.1 hypothetical protein SAMN05216315_11327 [Nitrosospira sp. Nsp18]
MKQAFFHVLMICLFLPMLWVIFVSLNSFGYPLMEQYTDKSVKFFIALPYFFLVASALYASSWIAERLAVYLVRSFGKPEESNCQPEDIAWPGKVLDSVLSEKNRSVFTQKVEVWLKDNIMAKIVVGVIIGFVLAI